MYLFVIVIKILKEKKTFAVVHFYPLWSTFTHCGPLLPTVVHFYPIKTRQKKSQVPNFITLNFSTKNGICIYLYILACFSGSILFRAQNGSARRTVYILACFSGSISLRRQNGSARRTVYVTLSGFISFRTQNRSRIDFLSALDAVFIFNPCDWNCWQRWRITQMGKVPLVLTPPFMRRAGEARRVEPARHGPPAGSKKRGDFSHLGESPPLAS